MRNIAIALAAATALLAAPAVHAKERKSGEEKLAEVLKGREAGKPVDCLPYTASNTTRIIDKTAIVYGSGNTVWVNRPSNADHLDDDDVLLTRSYTSRLCRLDTVQLRDRSGFYYNGFVGLEQFVPYRRVASNN